MLHQTVEIDDVSKAIDEKGYAVLYFTASWCGPCRALKPEYAKASVRDTQTEYFLMDVDESDPAVLKQFGIQSIPRVFYVTQSDATEITARKADKIVDEVSRLRQ